MGKVQELFNAERSGTLVLTPGEYEGPLVIDRPCVVDGAKSTLWANSGPVLQIKASGVTVKNLRVEVTGNPASGEASIAIKTADPATKLENIEVSGNVVGFAREAEVWNLPSIISLGNFAAGASNTFSARIHAAANAELSCDVANLKISPTRLTPGENRILLTTDEVRDNTILFGEIMVKTGVSRRIYVTGKSLKDAPVHTENIPVINGPTVSLPIQMEAPIELIAPNTDNADVRSLRRGQRISTKELDASLVRVVFDHQGMRQSMDIDSYTFALRDNGKVGSDDDLYFFGNPEAANHSIRTGGSDTTKPMILVDLNKVDPQISKIAVCFSIYGEDPRHTFSQLNAPAARIFGGDKEVFRFDLSDLSQEKTVVALEIYRYKGEWKMNFIGAGYKNGLKPLCESYGVNVE